MLYRVRGPEGPSICETVSVNRLAALLQKLEFDYRAQLLDMAFVGHPTIDREKVIDQAA